MSRGTFNFQRERKREKQRQTDGRRERGGPGEKELFLLHCSGERESENHFQETFFATTAEEEKHRGKITVAIVRGHF